MLFAAIRWFKSLREVTGAASNDSFSNVFYKIIPLIILILYTIFGGWIFLRLEGKPEHAAINDDALYGNSTEIFYNDTNLIIDRIMASNITNILPCEQKYKNVMLSLSLLFSRNDT